MKKEWTFTIKNPFYAIIYRWRLKRAVYRWNKGWVPIIEAIKDPREAWKWNQLVWQEIHMWIMQSSGDTIAKEFDDICERRGFDELQRVCLLDILTYVWLL